MSTMLVANLTRPMYTHPQTLLSACTHDVHV